MKKVVSTSLSVAFATGLYGISFGAIASASGLELWAIMCLSLLMFSGASQFAFVGVVASGGAPITAITSAWLLGVRNSFYAVRLSPVIKPTPIQRLFAAQLTIDESNAVSSAQEQIKEQKLGFWITGLGVYLFWNLATLLGAVAGDLLGSPEAWGLDAAAAAAFLALLWPKLKQRLVLALTAGLSTFFLTPLVPSGTAVLIAALVALWPERVKE